jgi:hypothetical protein
MLKRWLLIFPLLIAAVACTQASATDDDCVIVIDTPAQHYSWTGGNLGDDTPPAPPDGEWQANTAQEPHLNNPNVVWLGTVGEGLHYLPTGQEAAWFYFAPEVSHEECTPPTTVPPPTTDPPVTTEPPTTVPPPTVPPCDDCTPPPEPPPVIPPIDLVHPCSPVFDLRPGCHGPVSGNPSQTG